MGLNIAGVLFNYNIENEIELVLKNKIEFSRKVGYEEAIGSSRERKTIDILQTKKGTLIISEQGQLFDLGDTKDHVIQFINSDVSETYYF